MEKVGLSVSTVGRAMADDPRISLETKSRVRQAAAQLGYVGNLAARMLRGEFSNLIGLALPDVQNDFYASIAQSLSECCDRQGHRVVLSTTGDNRDAECRHLRDLAGARVAGVIIVPTASPRREFLAMLKILPHVQLLRWVSALADARFEIDNEAALEKAAARPTGRPPS